MYSFLWFQKNLIVNLWLLTLEVTVSIRVLMLGTWYLIRTFLAFWVFVGSLLIFEGPYFHYFDFIHAKNVIFAGIGSGLYCWQILVFTHAYALMSIHRSFGPYFGCWWSLLGPYFTKKWVLKALESLLVLKAVGNIFASIINDRVFREHIIICLWFVKSISNIHNVSMYVKSLCIFNTVHGIWDITQYFSNFSSSV